MTSELFEDDDTEKGIQAALRKLGQAAAELSHAADALDAGVTELRKATEWKQVI